MFIGLNIELYKVMSNVQILNEVVVLFFVEEDNRWTNKQDGVWFLILLYFFAFRWQLCTYLHKKF
jgi:hypothetical protein